MQDNHAATEAQADAQTYSERIDTINKATGGIYQAAVALLNKARDKGELPPELHRMATDALSDLLTLANCGLIALTEIAAAQNRIAAMAEQSRAITSENGDGLPKRRYIGQKPNSDIDNDVGSH